MRVSAIGGDPALRHGVFAFATWDLGKKPRLIEYQVLFAWTKKTAHLSEKSTLNGIQRACRTIVKECNKVPGATYPVAIDWTSSTGFMGRRITASVLSFFIGYLTREFETYGFPVIIITPAEVRGHFGLVSNVPKQTVWKELRSMMEPEHIPMKKEIAEDLRDALLLSYLAAVGRSRALREAS